MAIISEADIEQATYKSSNNTALPCLIATPPKPKT